jgi:hypothetical protein
MAVVARAGVEMAEAVRAVEMAVAAMVGAVRAAAARVEAAMAKEGGASTPRPCLRRQ